MAREVCGKCQKVQGTGTTVKIIKCNGSCNYWFHTKCVNINSVQYRLIMKLVEKVKWYCESCENLITHYFNNLNNFYRFINIVDDCTVEQEIVCYTSETSEPNDRLDYCNAVDKDQQICISSNALQNNNEEYNITDLEKSGDENTSDSLGSRNETMPSVLGSQEDIRQIIPAVDGAFEYNEEYRLTRKLEMPVAECIDNSVGSREEVLDAVSALHDVMYVFEDSEEQLFNIEDDDVIYQIAKNCGKLGKKLKSPKYVSKVTERKDVDKVTERKDVDKVTERNNVDKVAKKALPHDKEKDMYGRECVCKKHFPTHVRYYEHRKYCPVVKKMKLEPKSFNHQCKEIGCDYKCKWWLDMKKHLKNIHGIYKEKENSSSGIRSDNESADSNVNRPFSRNCPCGKLLKARSSFFRHRKNCSVFLKVGSPSGKVHYFCKEEECNFKCAFSGVFISHLKIAHNADIVKRTIQFSSYAEFHTWKLSFENETKSGFRLRKQTETEHDRVEYFYCDRSGHYVPKSDRQRQIKYKGLKKVGFNCTASMKIFIKKETENVVAVVVATHYGHGIY